MSSKKGVISLSVVLTIVIILFGNNWIPRIIDQFSGSVDHVQLQETKESDFVTEISDTQKNKSSVNIEQVVTSKNISSLPSSIESEKLNFDTEYSVDTLNYIILDGHRDFVKKYINSSREFLRLLDQDKINNLKKIIEYSEYFGVEYVYFDTAGKMIILLNNGSFGFADSKTKDIIWNCIFDEIEPVLLSPSTLVKRNNKWGLVNESGKVIIPVEFEDYSVYFEDTNFITFEQDGDLHIYNKNGDRIGETTVEEIYRVSDNHFICKNDNKYGLLDLDGEIKIDIECDSILVDLDNHFMYEIYLNGEILAMDENLKEESRLPGMKPKRYKSY